MYYFVSRVTNAVNRRLQILKEKTLAAFPPKTVNLRVNGTQIGLVNPVNYDYTNYLMLNPGIWEKNELRLFSILARYATVVFDVGANIGVYSILAEKVNKTAEIYAFEPYSTNYDKLLLNIEKNQCRNISPQMLALGDENKIISFNVPKNTAVNTSVASANAVFTAAWREFDEMQEIQVPQTTVDDFVKEKNIQKIDLIKMDVEYYEMHVLKGAVETIKKFKPAVLCEISLYEVLAYQQPALKDKIDPAFSEQLENFFKSLGYFMYAIGESGVMRTETVYSHPDNKNFLFSPYQTQERFVPFANKKVFEKLLPN